MKKRSGLKKRTVITLTESKGQVLINTGQDPSKIGKLLYGNFQSKETYFALFNENSEDIPPTVYVSKGHTQQSSKPGTYVFIFKASSPKSAESKAKKEARKRYIKHFDYSETTSNITINVQSNIPENSSRKQQRMLVRKTK